MELIDYNGTFKILNTNNLKFITEVRGYKATNGYPGDMRRWWSESGILMKSNSIYVFYYKDSKRYEYYGEVVVNDSEVLSHDISKYPYKKLMNESEIIEMLKSMDYSDSDIINLIDIEEW